MISVFREQGILTAHDQVVSLVAQQSAKAFQCKVTIHIGLEQPPWADPQQLCDIVECQLSATTNTMEWMPEMETTTLPAHQSLIQVLA